MIYHDKIPQEYLADAGAIVYEAVSDKIPFINAPKQVAEKLFTRFVGDEPIFYSVNDGELDGILLYSLPNKEREVSTKGAFLELGFWMTIRALINLAYMGYIFPQPKDCYFIDLLAVTEASRGKGLGRALLAEISVLANQNNSTPVALNVVSENKVAIGLYKSMGYKSVAVKKFGKIGRLLKIKYDSFITMIKHK